MSNRIPIVVPCALSENPYEERIDLVEQARSLITRLEDRIEAKFRVGNRKSTGNAGDGALLS